MYLLDPIFKHTFNSLGSSSGYEEAISEMGGLLSPLKAENPTFHADHHVYVKYCDGSSFTGFQEHQVQVGEEQVWFRGRNNLAATIKALLGAVHDTPCTMHHAPCTMHHAPCTMHHTPCTMHHTPYTIHHTPYTYTVFTLYALPY
jgi:hypothetical protein